MSCFIKKNGTAIDISAGAASCGNPSSEGVSSCCYNGDTCMSDGFCQYTHLVMGGSGYYRAGCTDASYNSPDCPPECSDEASPDAVYDLNTGAWACCGGSPATGFSCTEPIGPSFSGPAPAQLAIVREAPSAVATSTPAASSAPTGDVPNQGNHRGGHHNRGLSPQTIIGISVGASVAAVALVIMVAILLYRLHQRRKSQPFRRGSEPALLPAAVRNSDLGPDSIRAPRPVSHRSMHSAHSMHSTQDLPVRPSMSMAMSVAEHPHLRPLPLRQTTDVSALSYPPPMTARASNAPSISTWSSFSSNDRRASHLEISLPGLPGQSEHSQGYSGQDQYLHEMKGEMTPQELQAGKSPRSAKELQARELHLSLRAHPTSSSSAVNGGTFMSPTMSPALALAPGRGSTEGGAGGTGQWQGPWDGPYRQSRAL